MKMNSHLGSRSTGGIRGPSAPTATYAPAPAPFSLHHTPQSLAARRTAIPSRRDQMRAREMHFAPRTIAAKKSDFRAWALALVRPDIGRALRVRHRLQAVPNLLCSLAFSAPGPIFPVLGLAFLSTVDGLPIPLAGSPSPPASGCGLALRAAVSSLGTCGKKRLLAALEQTQPLPRLTRPLTGSRLAAFLMWAQGSCELPTAKPRTRSTIPPLRGALLAFPPRNQSPIQTTIARVGFPATTWDANQLQTTDSSLVPSWLLKWYPRRLLPTPVTRFNKL